MDENYRDRKWHIQISQAVWETTGVEPDEAVGQRVADLRRQKELRQEDFLALLEARGVAWTQTTLSRVEGGKRALKATELFAVADALGVDVAQLNPGGSRLYYQIQSARLKYSEALAQTRAAQHRTDQQRRLLLALLLANELSEGRAEHTVRGWSPMDFIHDLALALSPHEHRWQIGEGLSVLGIEEDEIAHERDLLLAEEFPNVPANRVDDDDHQRAEDRAAEIVLARHFPQLTFTDAELRTAVVEGLEISEVPSRATPFTWREDGG